MKWKLDCDASEIETGSGLQRREAKLTALSLSDRYSRQCLASRTTEAQQPFGCCAVGKKGRCNTEDTILSGGFVFFPTAGFKIVSKSFTSSEICPCQHGTFRP